MAPDTQDLAPDTIPLASRRNVLKAAWTAPVVLAISATPLKAFAQSNGSGSSSFSGSAAQVINGNNGCGNGDQSAPGGSLPNNGAENDTNGANCPPGSTNNGNQNRR